MSFIGRFRTIPSAKPLTEPRQRISWCTPSCCGGRWMTNPAEVKGGSGRTLRETVLESSPVLALLNQSFVSSWSLVKELEELQSNKGNPAHAQLASLHLEKYNFPVEMMVCLPNGTVVHHINANYFLDVTSMRPEESDEGNLFDFSAGFEDPSTATYIRFLKEGLEKAREYLGN
ncbi:UNVERIFIED_CONTAM: hypothetical protein FKN15_035326 [Acipenser sinensis]